MKPIHLGSQCCISNCSTIAMPNKNTSTCKIIKGTKTPIRYLIDKCHFKWLLNSRNNTNVT
jgi:hypothetical protein